MQPEVFTNAILISQGKRTQSNFLSVKWKGTFIFTKKVTIFLICQKYKKIDDEKIFCLYSFIDSRASDCHMQMNFLPFPSLMRGERERSPQLTQIMLPSSPH